MVSIITTVYNGQQYLEECLNSLCNQDDSDIELLLVDDGSSDQSGIICDRYARQDARIKVIHQTNQGLSSARNAALSMAKGQYLMFVDADDYVSHNYVSDMVSVMQQEKDADMAICRFYNRKEREDGTFAIEPCVSHPEQACMRGCDILTKRFGFMKTYYVVVWNKIYKRELFDGITFPVGRICEDAWISQALYCRCKKVICTEKLLYYYRNRVGSISSDPSDTWITAQLDWLEHEITFFARSNCPSDVIYPAREYLSMVFKHCHSKKVQAYRNDPCWKIAVNTLLHDERISFTGKVKYSFYHIYCNSQKRIISGNESEERN